MNMFRLVNYLLIVAFLAVLCTAACAGTYKDRDGSAHSWFINDAHVLVWDNSPYVPFGVVFEPRYLSDGQTDDNLKADEESIQAFALAGTKDVLIRVSKGIASVPVSAFQKIIDLLEENGFRYGIDLYDPPYTPGSGYLVQPAVNRVEGISGSGPISRVLPSSKNVVFVVCDAKTADIKQVGQAVTSNGEVVVQVAVPDGGNYVLLLYPLQTVDSSDSVYLPDIWRDYERHRDRLMAYLRQAKFGKGLRFFSDPFGSNLGISGQLDSLIPISPAFRIEYASWLSKKYRYPRELSDSWGIIRYDVATFEEAARLIPLWNAGRGVPAVYDPESKRTFSVNVIQSKLWSDFLAFRTESIRQYLDASADVFKRMIADVPVVYTATGLQPMFQASKPIGFDGLAVPPTSDSEALTAAAGSVYSLADNSSRSMWIIARVGPQGSSFQQKEELFKTMNILHDLGAKGFFLSNTGGSGISSADLLVWLGEYSALSATDKGYVGYIPRTIYYPDAYSKGKIKRLSSSLWWLPTLKPGLERDVGSSYAAYVIGDPKSPDSEIHIWSLSGKKTVTLVTANPLTTISVDGKVTEYQPKKGRVQLVLNEEPVIVKGLSAEYFLPVEAVEEKIQEFEGLITKAESKHMDASTYRRNLKLAREQLGKNQVGLCWDLIQTNINEITLRMRGLQNIPALPSGEASIPSSTVR